MRLRKAIGLSLALLFVSTTAMAKEASPGHPQPSPNSKPKPAKAVKAVSKSTGEQHTSKTKDAARARHVAAGRSPREQARLPPPDEYVGSFQVVGAREVGAAAWYGGRHLGRRTASGDRLDAVHATAAHRSLPMHSLVRVTNLSNGNSVICKITDRGPVSPSLLIDVSPRVAERLDMKRSGIAKVSIEPVAPGAHPSH